MSFQYFCWKAKLQGKKEVGNRAFKISFQEARRKTPLENYTILFSDQVKEVWSLGKKKRWELPMIQRDFHVPHSYNNYRSLGLTSLWKDVQKESNLLFWKIVNHPLPEIPEHIIGYSKLFQGKKFKEILPNLTSRYDLWREFPDLLSPLFQETTCGKFQKEMFSKQRREFLEKDIAPFLKKKALIETQRRSIFQDCLFRDPLLILEIQDKKEWMKHVSKNPSKTVSRKLRKRRKDHWKKEIQKDVASFPIMCYPDQRDSIFAPDKPQWIKVKKNRAYVRQSPRKNEWERRDHSKKVFFGYSILETATIKDQRSMAKVHKRRIYDFY